MPIYKPSELRLFLQQLGIQPRKGLSQNFLIDGNILRKIALEAVAGPEDVILEIGPGPGSLTEVLLETGAKVIAVEKDPILAEALQRLKTDDNRLEIHCNDIMDVDIEAIVKSHGRRAKVVANLPYHITTPILAKLIPLHHLFSQIVVMVQDEVGRRFVGVPGTKEYGHFTLFLNFYSDVRYCFQVSKNCFYPIPQVNSAVVALYPKPPPGVSDQERFFVMTRTAFEHRRKMLRASLRDLYPQEKITAALTALGIDPQARPEMLSLEQFLLLFQLLEVR